jgi:hypothetical protein
MKSDAFSRYTIRYPDSRTETHPYPFSVPLARLLEIHDRHAENFHHPMPSYMTTMAWLTWLDTSNPKIDSRSS